MKAQQLKKQSSVERILAAALEIFAESGFEGARIDEIATRAAVNKAMIYYHIGDKKALYARVLHDVFTDTAARLTERVVRAQTPVTKLKAYIRSMAATFEQHPLLPPIMMREFASAGRNLPDAVTDSMLLILDTVAGIVKQGRKEKVFIHVQPLVLHLMVVGTMTYLRSTRSIRRRIAGLADKKILLPGAHADTATLTDVEKLVLRAIKR